MPKKHEPPGRRERNRTCYLPPVRVPGVYCSTHRVPSDTKRRSLPYLLPLLSVPAPIPVQADTRPLLLLASGAFTELLPEQSTWVARARCRSTFEGSFRRHEAGCRFGHFCEQTFAPHSVVSAFLRRLLCFPPSHPIKETRSGVYMFDYMQLHMSVVHMYCVVVVRMGGSIASLNPERLRSIAYAVCST